MAADKGMLVSPELLALLRATIREEMGSYKNPRSRPGYQDIDQQEILPPELYLAKTLEGGIPAIDGEVPGKAFCQVMKIDPTTGLTEAYGVEMEVHNYTEAEIEEDTTVPIGREKYGNWVVLAGGGGKQFFLARITAGAFKDNCWNYAWERWEWDKGCAKIIGEGGGTIGGYVKVTTDVEGNPDDEISEEQTLEIIDATDGTFDLFIDGVLVEGINYDGSNLQSQIDASALGSGYITVTGLTLTWNDTDDHVPVEPDCTNLLPKAHYPLHEINNRKLTASEIPTFVFATKGYKTPKPNPVIETTREANEDEEETQEISVHWQCVKEGTWTLTLDGEETEELEYDVNAADLQNELETIVGVGNVTVTGTGEEGDPYVITFPNDYDTHTLTANTEDIIDCDNYRFDRPQGGGGGGEGCGGVTTLSVVVVDAYCDPVTGIFVPTYETWQFINGCRVS